MTKVNVHTTSSLRIKRGYKTTIEGLNGKFNPEFWNYAKLISGVLRYGMPIDQVVKLVQDLNLNSETINTWKNGVERTEEIPTERNRSQRSKMSCLWIRNIGISRRLYEMYKLWCIEMRIKHFSSRQ